MNATAEYLTVSQAARQLGVSPATLRRWDSDGVFVAERTVGGHRRYRRAHLLGWRTRAQREELVNAFAEYLSPTLPLPTGIAPLDEALGGGLRRGGLWGVYGPARSGKTAIALQTVATLARAGHGSVFCALDALSEHVQARLRMLLEPEAYARVAVCELDPRLLITPAFIGELVADTAARSFAGRTPALVVVDPVWAVLPFGKTLNEPDPQGEVPRAFFELADQTGTCYLLTDDAQPQAAPAEGDCGRGPAGRLDYYNWVCHLGSPEAGSIELTLLKNRYGREMSCALAVDERGGLDVAATPDET